MWGLLLPVEEPSSVVVAEEESSSSVSHATLPPHMTAGTGSTCAAAEASLDCSRSRLCGVMPVAVASLDDAPPLMAPLPRYIVPTMARPARVARPTFIHTRELSAECEPVAGLACSLLSVTFF